jgi:hypothetical protein
MKRPYNPKPVLNGSNFAAIHGTAEFLDVVHIDIYILEREFRSQ